ncbi:hypothetical protein OG920_42090 [Streptomyces europaeiscabiei]|uniref:hypothetical protein n=1 Tax=Streptomyces europaeiscabiei TaxID=146819 RepID=UPI0029BEC7AD|nr:hypothetical protein [Streptomyces europaeiscabiei]MDX3580894.1 hypothetical protein [Streptomyces europaeiscabiei]MDX3615604.1 hypothetical protein [Streptomyces europaeiscabiei]MDX3631005.1 hypothetical protein [Streptomyces europaeiscabiei]MDX3648981.1 hypothetical protein [Streptomyces europaeiscabiei]
MTLPSLPVSQVEVVLCDCSAQDAERVFACLRAHFETDRRSDDPPHETGTDRPTMWTGMYDTAAAVPSGAGVHPEPPSAPVTVEVQGSPPAVRLLREALEEVYSVRQVGVDAGDQEVQLQLRVEGREGRG